MLMRSSYLLPTFPLPSLPLPTLPTPPRNAPDPFNFGCLNQILISKLIPIWVSTGSLPNLVDSLPHRRESLHNGLTHLLGKVICQFAIVCVCVCLDINDMGLGLGETQDLVRDNLCQDIWCTCYMILIPWIGERE